MPICLNCGSVGLATVPFCLAVPASLGSVSLFSEPASSTSSRGWPTRLKLTMPSLDQQTAEWQGSEPQSSCSAKDEGSATPRRPSFSPVTPTISHTSWAADDDSARPSPEWIDEPEPLPVSLEDNPDAIALRA